MMVDESIINMETIHQILHKDLQKRKMCAKFVSHRLTDKQKQRRKTHITPRLHPDMSRRSQFSSLHFAFPKVKIALKGNWFQDAEDTEKNVMAKLSTVPLEAFADCFQECFK
jgi:hypothetical protein